MVDGTFRLIYPDLTVEFFDSVGRLIKIQDRNKNKMEFFYDICGQLSTVMDTMGRLIQFEYYPFVKVDMGGDIGVVFKPESGRLKCITDFANRKFEFVYDPNTGDLVEEKFIERVNKYTYTKNSDKIKILHNLKEVIETTDTGDKTLVTVNYDVYNQDKVVQQDFNLFTVDFTCGQTAEVTDGKNIKRIFKHYPPPIDQLEYYRVDTFQTNFTYTNEGLLETVTFPQNNTLTYTYDSSSKYRRFQGNLKSVVSSGQDCSGSGSGPDSITIGYDYDNQFNQLRFIYKPNGNQTVEFILDSNTGNVNEAIYPGGLKYTYTYNKFGQLETVTDNRDSITEYIYYPEQAPGGTGIGTVSARVLDNNTGGYLNMVTIDKGKDNLETTYEYDLLGQVTKVTDGEGAETIYNYHPQYWDLRYMTEGAVNQNSVLLPVNLYTEIDYYKKGYFKSATTSGITTEYRYDHLNRLSEKIMQGIGLTQSYGYDYGGNSNLSKITYPKGNYDTFEYNSRDLLEVKKEGTDPANNQYSTITTYNYTDNGLILDVTSGTGPEAILTHFRHDCHGRLNQVSDAYGNHVDYTYDNNSNLTNLDAFGTDGTTFNIEKEYNGYDFLTHDKVQKGGNFLITEYIPNASGMLEEIKNPKGYSLKTPRTGAGLLDKIIAPKDQIIEYSHDKRGLPSSAQEWEEGTNTLNHNFSHGVLGDQTLRNDDLNRKWKFDNKPQLNPLSRDDVVQDPQQSDIISRYDGLARINSIEHPVNDQQKAIITHYYYDLNNNLTDIEDAENNLTHYDYDSKDRLSDIYYPDQRKEHFEYYSNDRLKAYIDPNNNQLSYKYDNAGRLWRIDVIKGAGVGGPDYEEYQYDGLGMISHIITPDSHVEFKYDKAGRVEKEIQDGIEVGYGYDDNNNLTELHYPSGKTLIITHDELDRIDNITENTEEVVKYGYEGLGKITEKTIRGTVEMSSGFDKGKRMESLSYKNKILDDTYMKQAMKWNLVNLKTEEKDDKRILTYFYDKKYRLDHIEETKRNNKQLSYKAEYTIDNVDNIRISTETKEGQVETSQSTPNSLNQIDKINNKVLSYDKNGNLTGFEHQYEYDWKNRLIKVITGTGLNVEFKYDGLGRRTRKIITAPGETEVTRYIYAGWRVIEERKGAAATNNDVINRYTYGNGIDERIEMEKPVVKEDNIVEWKRYFFLHDSIGNVIGLTNHNGHLIERYKYTPYGEVTFYNGKIQPDIDGIIIKNGKIYIRFKQQVDLETMYVSLRLTHTQVEIGGSASLLKKDREIEFSPTDGLKPNDTLTLKVERIGDSGPVEILTKNFTYNGLELQIVHDEESPRVERVKYKNNSFFIDFSEEIDPATTFNNIEITLGDTKIPGTIEITGDNQVKLTLDSHLSDNTTYMVQVKEIGDYAGNIMSVFYQDFQLDGQETELLVFELSILTENDKSVVGNNSLFHGRTYDPESRLYYYRNRYYHPALGRFLQRDPMGYEDSMNLYQAFGMNPVNFNDPFGKDVLGSCSSSYQPFLKPSENEEIIKKQLRSYALVGEGIANAATKTFLIPAKYITLPARLAFGFDFDVNVNFTEEGSVIGGYLGKKDRLDIVKEQTIVFPLADFATQTSHDVYFGLFYQGGNSPLGESSRENLARSAGALEFNILFWGNTYSRIKAEASRISSNLPVKYDPEFASIQLFGRELKIGTVSSEQMRALYDPKVKLLNIDLPPTMANAEFIHALRNAYKRLARDLMADRAAAARLDKNYPLHPFDYYMKKYSEQGFSGEALWRRIMEGGKTPNKNVSKKYGID